MEIIASVKNNAPRPRLAYLDSIRGIAAVLVLLHHCWGAKTVAAHQRHMGWDTAYVSWHNLMFYCTEKILESGRAAVMLFFVLSGFVLAYSQFQKPESYGRYAARRFFRLYPVFAAVILGSYVLHHLLSMDDDVGTGWIKGLYSIPYLSPAVLLKHFLMLGNWPNNALDPVMWSLVHEMRISLLFPFIFFLVGRYRGRAVAGCFLLSLLCTGCTLLLTGTIATGLDDAKVLTTFLSTGYFVIFFACGAFLAIARKRVAEIISGFTPWKLILLAVFCAYCLLKSEMDGHALTGALADYLHGIGALLLIAMAMGLKRFRNGLNHTIFRELGRLSYSLYLVHLPIAYAVNHSVNEGASAFIVCAFIIALSFPAAELLNRLVEKPCAQLYRKYSGRSHASASHPEGYVATIPVRSLGI